ncbi:hypothetical protein [Clostridium arbusti]|nr:hypothetical protein [Clostridium arbusti]
MKKIILILLSFMLVLSTVACTNNSNKSSATGQNENTSSNYGVLRSI